MGSSFALLSLLYCACPAGKGVGGPAPDAHAARSDDGGAPRGAASNEPADPDACASLSRDEICARAPAAHAAGLDGKKPFSDLDAHCKADNAFCDTVDKSPDPRATCFVANDNIARAERNIFRGSNDSLAAWWQEHAWQPAQ